MTITLLRALLPRWLTARMPPAGLPSKQCLGSLYFREAGTGSEQLTLEKTGLGLEYSLETSKEAIMLWDRKSCHIIPGHGSFFLDIRSPLPSPSTQAYDPLSISCPLTDSFRMILYTWMEMWQPSVFKTVDIFSGIYLEPCTCLLSRTAFHRGCTEPQTQFEVSRSLMTGTVLEGDSDLGSTASTCIWRHPPVPCEGPETDFPPSEGGYSL